MIEPEKGHRADQNAEVDLDFVNDLLRRRQTRSGRIHEVGEADQHGRQTDQAVQDGDQFRHLRHLHAAREAEADEPADDQPADQDGVIAVTTPRMVAIRAMTMPMMP